MKTLIKTENNNPVDMLFIHGASHGTWCWDEHFVGYFRTLGYITHTVNLREDIAEEMVKLLTLNDYVERVTRMIVTIKKPIILVGHSMGGAIIQKLLLNQTPYISKVIMLAPTPPEGILKYFLGSLITNFNKSSAELFFSNRVSKVDLSRYKKLLVPDSNKVMKLMFKRIVPLNFNTKVPMMVIGSWSDRCVSPKAVFSTALFYRCNITMVDKLCHDMMLDKEWKKVAVIIEEFSKDA